MRVLWELTRIDYGHTIIVEAESRIACLASRLILTPFTEHGTPMAQRPFESILQVPLGTSEAKRTKKEIDTMLMLLSEMMKRSLVDEKPYTPKILSDMKP